MLLKQFCLDIRIRFRDLLDMVRQVTVPIDLLLPGFPKMLGESGIFKEPLNNSWRCEQTWDFA